MDCNDHVELFWRRNLREDGAPCLVPGSQYQRRLKNRRGWHQGSDDRMMNRGIWEVAE